MAGTDDGWRLRRAVPDDAEALTHLHLDAWDDAYRGLLPDALLDDLRGDADASLWVLEGNERAEVFLARHGFVPDGATKDDDGHGRERRLVRLRVPGPHRTPG